jgi:tRNA uridine 5-carbamoylmethylation protein Kti12
MNTCFIMGGVPGSGKSTAARAIAQSHVDGSGEFWIEKSVTYFGVRHDDGTDTVMAAIHSTDQYFMKDGEYRFNPKQIGIFHNANYKAFRESIMNGIPIVICDNTNTQQKEWSKYAKEAKAQDYIVVHATLPHPHPDVATERNAHGVPKDAINRMISRWQSERQ